MTEDLREGLALVSDLLPGVELVFYTRAALGDHRFTWLTGDVEGVTGHPGHRFGSEPGYWLSVLHPADQDRVPASLSVLVERPTRNQLHLQYRILDPDGQVRWVRDDMRVLRDRAGRPSALLGVLRDVSAEWELERKLTSVQERLWESQRMESLGALAGGIAHDFNNLLTAILSSAQLLEEDGALTREAREDVRVIKNAARKGAAMVRQILDFAARTSSKAEPVDMGEVMGDMETILSRTLGADIQLRVEAAGPLAPVNADPGRLEQVLLNLAVNAREAMVGGGVLEIRADTVSASESLPVHSGRLPEGTYVRLTVRDNGPGIPDHVVDRIFEPFFSTKRREGSGSGVGLATVQRIVRGYGGGIRVDSRPGSGAAFHVFLPAGRSAEARVIPEAHVAEEQPSNGKARILVVEDDPRVRKVVERVLQRDGHLVVAVGMAEEGLQVFDRVRPPFNLLVADVVLPDRSGPELYRALTRRVPTLPVLYVSGFGEDEVVRRGAREPGVFFLPKPFRAKELTEMVDEILQTVGLAGTVDPEAGATGA